MIRSSNPYDELIYRSYPIEWTAPERLALTSLLHGGPRMQLEGPYRVLELGCGNGTNLLPLAFYRRHATFVGVDGARSQIEVAIDRAAAVDVPNVTFIHCDLVDAARRLPGQFDYIIAHGVFSWISDGARDALLRLVAARLRHGGLLYVNYNSKPAWNLRGMVRDFLMAQTAAEEDYRRRAELAQAVAAKVVGALSGVEHSYSRLLANEFRFVSEGDVSWVGHEFLAPENHAYWRSEFLAMAEQYGLAYVADADFNYSSDRTMQDLAPWLNAEQITGRSVDDTVDLLCYRQLHSPILTPSPLALALPDVAEFSRLWVASCLEPDRSVECDRTAIYTHPSGYEVEAKNESMRAALTALRTLWPRGLKVGAAFPDAEDAMDDLLLLHRSGLIELRCVEPGDYHGDGDAMNRLERSWNGHFTTPYHQVRMAT